MLRAYLEPKSLIQSRWSIVPGSNPFKSLSEAHDSSDELYLEVPTYGQAGICVPYDTAIFCARLDRDGKQRRRTWHHTMRATDGLERSQRKLDPLFCPDGWESVSLTIRSPCIQVQKKIFFALEYRSM